MNKIFKVVWSKVKNSYVVASELAKSRTKAPKSGMVSRTVVAGVLACVLSCGAVMPNVQAEPQLHSAPQSEIYPYLAVGASYPIDNATEFMGEYPVVGSYIDSFGLSDATRAFNDAARVYDVSVTGYNTALLLGIRYGENGVSYYKVFRCP